MLLTSWFHLFQTCVIYQLEDGRIVYQHGASKFSNIGPCSRSIKHLQSMIWETFLQKGRVMCCQSNGCNGGIPREIMENDRNKEVFIEKYYESFAREFQHINIDGHAASNPSKRYQTKTGGGERTFSSSSSSGKNIGNDDGNIIISIVVGQILTFLKIGTDPFN